jgi:hypothetical protein
MNEGEAKILPPRYPLCTKLTGAWMSMLLDSARETEEGFENAKEKLAGLESESLGLKETRFSREISIT